MKGIYILIIDIDKNLATKTGTLGRIEFTKGLYAYVGSAQNNLEKRVLRHLSKHKKIKWHIDYLFNNSHTRILKVFYKKANKTQECKTAKNINNFGSPINGFGSSDCKCKSHLFKIKNLSMIQKLNFDEYKK